jgi:hypothetical protein
VVVVKEELEAAAKVAAAERAAGAKEVPVAVEKVVAAKNRKRKIKQLLSPLPHPLMPMKPIFQIPPNPRSN